MHIGKIDTLKELNQRMLDDDLNGFWHVPEEIYHSCNAIGHSLLLKYQNSPASYLAASQKKFEATPDMVIGKLVHALMLEGEDAYKSRCVVPPEINKRTKAGREEWAQWVEHHKDRIVIDESADKKIREIVAAISPKLIAKNMLSNGHAELSCFARVYESDLWIRVRPDYYLPDLNVVVDLKTTKCSNAEEFERDIFRYNYDMQAAFYMDTIKTATEFEVKGYYCLGVEKQIPFDAYPFRMDGEVLDLGRAKYAHYVRQHMDCIKANNWPGSDGEIRHAHAPHWELKKWGML